MIEAIIRDPFAGIGKPEPLKYLAAGTLSRRLTEEHRIVYLVSADRIDILQARYHYCACDKLHKERNRSFQCKATPAPVGQVH